MFALSVRAGESISYKHERPDIYVGGRLCLYETGLIARASNAKTYFVREGFEVSGPRAFVQSEKDPRYQKTT